MRTRRFDDRVELLEIVGKNDAGHCPRDPRNPNRPVHEMQDLLGDSRHVHVLARDILEEGQQIHFLLVVAPECAPRLLADDRHDWLMVELRIIEPIEQVNGAGP